MQAPFFVGIYHTFPKRIVHNAMSFYFHNPVIRERYYQ